MRRWASSPSSSPSSAAAGRAASSSRSRATSARSAASSALGLLAGAGELGPDAARSPRPRRRAPSGPPRGRVGELLAHAGRVRALDAEPLLGLLAVAGQLPLALGQVLAGPRELALEPLALLVGGLLGLAQHAQLLRQRLLGVDRLARAGPRRSPLRAIRAACWSCERVVLGAHVGELLAQRRALRVGALELLAQPLALGFGPLGLGLRRSGRAQLRELGLEAIEPLGLLGTGGGLRRRRVRHRLGRLGDGLGLRRAAARLAQLGDLRAQLGQLGAQALVGRARLGGAALAAPRRRQVDDQAAADLQLGRLDVGRAVRPGERRPPRLAALAGQLPAGERRQAPAAAVGLDGQHRAAPAGGPSAPASGRTTSSRSSATHSKRSSSNDSSRVSAISASSRLPRAGPRSRSVSPPAARTGAPGLGRRRAVVDGGDALARLAALDRERERHAAEAQHGAGEHHERRGEREPGARPAGRRRRRRAAGSGSRRSRARAAASTSGRQPAPVEHGDAPSAIRPSAATSAASASAASSTSATSKASHADSPPYQSRNRLTSSTRLPTATISGPISNRLIAYRKPGRASRTSARPHRSGP